MKLIRKKMFDTPKYGFSVMSCNEIEVIGERLVESEGKIYEQYIYNIVGYTPANEKPFAALKENIILF